MMSAYQSRLFLSSVKTLILSSSHQAQMNGAKLADYGTPALDMPVQSCAAFANNSNKINVAKELDVLGQWLPVFFSNQNLHTAGVPLSPWFLGDRRVIKSGILPMPEIFLWMADMLITQEVVHRKHLTHSSYTQKQILAAYEKAFDLAQTIPEQDDVDHKISSLAYKSMEKLYKTNP